MRGIIPILSAIFLSLTNAASAVETDIELSYVTAFSSGSAPISLKETINLRDNEGKAAAVIMSNFEAFLFLGNYKPIKDWKSVESLTDSLKLTKKGWSIPLAFKETPTIAKVDLDALKNQPLNIIITGLLAIEGKTPTRILISHNALNLSALDLSKLKAITVAHRGLSTTPHLDAPFDVVFNDTNDLILGAAQDLRHISENQSIINVQPFEQFATFVHQIGSILGIFNNNNSHRPQEIKDIEVSYVTTPNVPLKNDETILTTQLTFQEYKAELFLGDYRGQIPTLGCLETIREQEKGNIIEIGLSNDDSAQLSFKLDPVSAIGKEFNAVITCKVVFPENQTKDFLFRHIIVTAPETPFTKIQLIHKGLTMKPKPFVFVDFVFYNGLQEVKKSTD